MKRLGDIQLYAELKRSDTCTTYRGFDLERQEFLLVKVLDASPQSRNHPVTSDAEKTGAEAVQRFEHEAAVYATITHPNVVRLSRHGVCDQQPFIALEFVEGQNLRQLLEDSGPLPITVSLLIARDLLAGLAAIHRANVIHRDLKPENVMIGNDGLVKICDFGLAALPAAAASAKVSGSAGYLSPEMILSNEISARSDLFSLGVILYEMLVGSRPFSAATPAAEMDTTVRNSHFAISMFRADVPQGLERLIDQLLAKSPEARPASAAQALQALEREFAFPSSGERQSYLQRYLAHPPEHVEAEWIRQKPAPKARKRRPARYWAGVSGAAVVVLLVSIWWYAFQRPEIEGPGQVALDPETRNPLDSLVNTSPIPAGEKQDITGAGTDLELAAGGEMPAENPESPPEESKPAVLNSGDDAVSPLSTSTGEPSIASLRRDAANTAPSLQSVFIRCSPWAELAIDGQPQGIVPRPQPFELSRGRHNLVFRNAKFPAVPFKIEVGDSTPDTLYFSLWEHVAVVELQITPWAEVYVDGSRHEYSPEDRKIILNPGAHLLRFFHPVLGEKNEAIEVRAGEKKVITVNMFHD